jgi:hypothetical protein
MAMRRIRVLAAALALGGVAAVAVPAAAPAAAGDLVGAVDQAHRQVLVLDQNAGSWNGNGPVRWRWTAPAGSAWANLSDVKFRTDHNGVRVVLVAASGGGVASINYRTHHVIWQSSVPGNPHSIELLPNGAVAVAASTGSRVWYFPYGSRRAVSTPLADAHAVLYNDGRLWALGGSALNQYDYTKTALHKHGRSITGGGLSGGHDLAAMTNDRRHRMWLTGNRVYWFDKYAGNPKPVAFGGQASRASVKSFGTQHDGRIVETYIPGCVHTCRSDHVYLFDYAGNGQVTRTRSGAGFYKARPVVWGYYG